MFKYFEFLKRKIGDIKPMSAKNIYYFYLIGYCSYYSGDL